MTHTPWYFHALSALEHILISKDNQDADGFRFRNPYVQLYRLSFSTLVPCEPRKRYPPPNCLLRTHFIRFPCGTFDATISQVDNCIVTVRAQHFLQCLVFYLNHKSSLNYILTQESPEKRGCALIPCHLLNGVGINVSLFSPAKATHFTKHTNLSFLIAAAISDCLLSTGEGEKRTPARVGLHCRVRPAQLFIIDSL